MIDLCHRRCLFVFALWIAIPSQSDMLDSRQENCGIEKTRFQWCCRDIAPDKMKIWMAKGKMPYIDAGHEESIACQFHGQKAFRAPDIENPGSNLQTLKVPQNPRFFNDSLTSAGPGRPPVMIIFQENRLIEPKAFESLWP